MMKIDLCNRILRVRILYLFVDICSGSISRDGTMLVSKRVSLLVVAISLDLNSWPLQCVSGIYQQTR